MTRHQYGVSALVSQTSFRWETSGCVEQCRLFSQATLLYLFFSAVIGQGRVKLELYISNFLMESTAHIVAFFIALKHFRLTNISINGK